MKKKGFTLIELLAVIVILAIIALIAIPLVYNITNNSRKQSNERSIDLYANAIRNGISAYELETGNEVSSGVYTQSEPLPFEVQYEGDVECSTIILYEDGKLYLEGCKVNEKMTEYVYGTKPKTKTYANGEVVYYDVSTGKGCTTYTESQSNTGVKTGCMKFYAFNDDGGYKLNLILDHNTTADILWNGTGDYSKGPSELLEQLKTDTNTWVGTTTPKNYTLDQSETTVGVKYTIDYTGYKARLITANEIAQITGNTGWDEASESSIVYYFHDLSSNYQTGRGNVCVSTGCTYGWLYDRTHAKCTDDGCYNNSDLETYGYWTASSSPRYDYFAYYVAYFGLISNSEVYYTNTAGVRPVITIPKFQI